MTLTVALLWLAALACATMAVRARVSDGPRRPGPPAPLRWAGRIPAPRALQRLSGRADTERRLREAGLAGRLSTSAVSRARAGALVAGALVAAVLALLAPPASLVGLVVAAGGYLAPDRWIARRAERRRAEIDRDLPDLLDLIGVCVGAGMPLDAALRMSAERTSGPLADEVGRMLRMLALGTPRRAAYRDLAERTGSAALARTVGALIQSDELGAPMADAVAAQAGEMRSARDATAREIAAKAAPKIQLVVALLMVPAVLLVVMAVLVTEMARQVGVVVGGS